jgi:hypothetical protein
VFQRATNLAVAKPHRKSLGRYEFDMIDSAEPQRAVLREEGGVRGGGCIVDLSISGLGSAGLTAERVPL